MASGTGWLAKLCQLPSEILVLCDNIVAVAEINSEVQQPAEQQILKTLAERTSQPLEPASMTGPHNIYEQRCPRVESMCFKLNSALIWASY